MGLSCTGGDRGKLLKRAAAAGFLFFLAKGILWLILLVGGIIWAM